MMLIDNRFNIGQKVYLDTDVDQKERFIVGILLRDNGISYELSCGTEMSWNYDFEITKEKNVLKTTTN